MFGHKKKYDLICSLGGNCAAAHNLLYRGLRHYSLPFDWCYIKNDKPIEYLCEGFQNNFKDFLLKENLVPLTGEEYNNSHTTNAQYKDILTGYYFVNHFTKDADFDEDYEIVYAKIKRRLNRLLNKIVCGKNILFVLTASFYIDIEKIKNLKSVLQSSYPDKNFDFYVMFFNQTENKISKEENFTVKYCKRPLNVKDFNETNKEWKFLDKISLNAGISKKSGYEIGKTVAGGYSVIGSFHGYSKTRELHYIFKTLYYKIFNKSRYYLYISKNPTKGCGNIEGHPALANSLFRGFKKLGIDYEYNKITGKDKNLILLWADEKDLETVNKLKKNGKVDKVVTVPTACKYDYDYMQWHFPEVPCIDKALYASDWVANICKSKANKKYWDKILSWPSGVEVSDVKPETKINNSCIVYLKRVADEKSKVDDLISFIETLGIKCYIIEYPKYDFNYWQELLPNVDFVIFYQDDHETQGLAIAEAWAKNKPSFVKNTVNGNGEITQNAPYLTKDTGLSWNNTEELKTIILKYKNNPQEFLASFTPYDWVKENMSDEVSVKMLLDIFNSIGVNNE